MGFNKKILSEKLIRETAKIDLDSFKNVFKGDGFIFEDSFSKEIFHEMRNTNKEDIIKIFKRFR